MSLRPFLLLPLLACTPADSGGDSGGGVPITAKIVTPKDGDHFDWDEAIELEAGARQGPAAADMTGVTWTVGDKTARGPTAEITNLAPGDYTVTVDVVVGGEHYGDSVDITVNEKPADTGGGDTGGDTGAPPDSITYVGAMNAHVWYDGTYGAFDGDCPGNVTVYIVKDGTMSGTGHCVLDGQYDMDFLIDGTQGGGKVSGALVANVDGTDYRTPFNGTGKDGGHLEATYDKTFQTGGDSLRIAGDWSADPQ